MGASRPQNPSVFSGIRLFILIYQKLQFYVELAGCFLMGKMLKTL